MYVNNDNLDYLNREDVKQLIWKYYDSAAQYIKAVIEEYVEKPYVEREAIYFYDNMQKIELAVESGRMISFVSGGAKYIVRPYGITTDMLTSYNYFVCYKSSPKMIASFRLARMSDIIVENKTDPLSDEECNHVTNTLLSKGVQFLAGSSKEIRVRFTEKGMREFRKHINIRPKPNPDKSAGNDLVFYCTEWQAITYFFKFGREAEVISPIGLRRKFNKLYSDACLKYSE